MNSHNTLCTCYGVFIVRYLLITVMNIRYISHVNEHIHNDGAVPPCNKNTGVWFPTSTCPITSFHLYDNNAHSIIYW